MKISWLFFFSSVAAVLHAQSAAVGLPSVTVYSPRVANQSPVGTFTMPVSTLRYEPRVDLQARNLAEGQGDISIRGGIFENTGFQLGSVTLLDPQTGHYFAEIPVAP
ncbi:MAG: TonB-dependent receptor, partial [Opitutaceae bacterium]